MPSPSDTPQTQTITDIVYAVYNGGWVDAGNHSLNPGVSSMQPERAITAIQSLVEGATVGEHAYACRAADTGLLEDCACTNRKQRRALAKVMGTNTKA